MNPQITNSTNSVTTSTKRKREAERSMNWTVEETQVLLCAWSDERVQKSLAENLRNRHVFKHLSVRMSDMGFSRSPHQCRLRVKTLKANYVRAKVLKSVDGSQPCSFRYYAEMDAVLGRKAMDGMGGMGGTHLGSVVESGGRHLGFLDGAEGGHFDSMDDTVVRSHIGSMVGVGGGRLLGHLGPEIKLEEERDASTDEFEFSNSTFMQTSVPRRQRIILRESLLHPRHIDIGVPMEDDLSSEAPSPLPPPPPQPAFRGLLPSPPPPDPNPSPGVVPILIPDDDPSPATTTIPNNNNNHPLSQPLHSAEPALKHLAECFQGLVSESRQLLVQLETQRQEQGRWHQELLAHWLERDERRQKEAADREDRRETARMEHEIRVLQLLTGLAQQRPCSRCSGAETAPAETTPAETTPAEVSSPPADQTHTNEEGDGFKSDTL